MSTNQLKIPDDMQEELLPYRNHLRQLLKLGLQEWKRRTESYPAAEQNRLLDVLRSADEIVMPMSTQSGKPRSRWTPVPIQGRSVSEILIEMRY